MTGSAERRAGEPVAVAYHTTKTDKGLLVGLLLINSNPPEALTFSGVQYETPGVLLNNPQPVQARGIILRSKTT